MISKRIEAIFFDMGGTLRRSNSYAEHKLNEISQILQLLGSNQDPIEFDRQLSSRAQAYDQWSKQTLIALNEEELWSRWMLPEWSEQTIVPLAAQLNRLWRGATGTHTVLSETGPVILELFRRGYRLGLISNTNSPSEAPQALHETGIRDCFDLLLLSAEFGKRKPDPSLFLEASRAMLVQPEHCAYVGNNLKNDVAGSRVAGFAETIILRNPRKPLPETIDNPVHIPDHIIDNLNQLLEIFPPRYQVGNRRSSGKKPGQTKPVYDASLSSMWAIGRFSRLVDFCRQTEQLGFARIELNHQVNSSMLEGFDLGDYQFSSVHEPCPADVSMPVQKEHDWLISSEDEDNRLMGARMIKRSINLAHELGAKMVVVHSGNAGHDQGIEDRLRKLHDSGLRGSPEFQELKARIIQIRNQQIEPRFDAVQKSLRELLEYAAPMGICLCLENRYHYMDIPGQDELQILLELADNDRLGFQYDTGHAQTLDRLGFYDQEEWLRRYAQRILGTHLHDVHGVHDHQAPGLGEFDFTRLATYLPLQAVRTIEISPRNTPEQIQTGMQLLLKTGCVSRL